MKIDVIWSFFFKFLETDKKICSSNFTLGIC